MPAAYSTPSAVNARATALVLGAGGAARAAVWALREAGAEVTVWNRTPSRATCSGGRAGSRPRERPGAAELLVNATSVGLRQRQLAGLPLVEAETVVDLVYGSEPTPFARWGAERGARVMDGIEMLVYQGARTFERWTGRPAPVERCDARVVRPMSSTYAHA